MERFLGRFTPHLFAILRFLAGVMFLLHGTQKLFSWPAPGPPSLTPLQLAGGWIELVCGALIAVGFLGSWAAFLASGEMAVAYFMFHAPKGFYPTMNDGEVAVLYCFLFLYIAAHGSGIWSVDSALWRGRRA